jgi:hypothetical protein
VMRYRSVAQESCERFQEALFDRRFGRIRMT